MIKNLLFISITLFGMSMNSNAQTVASGSTSLSSYSLCASGFPKASGYSVYGQLGDGTGLDSITPVSVRGMSGITAKIGVRESL